MCTEMLSKSYNEHFETIKAKKKNNRSSGIAKREILFGDAAFLCGLVEKSRWIWYTINRNFIEQIFYLRIFILGHLLDISIYQAQRNYYVKEYK